MKTATTRVMPVGWHPELMDAFADDDLSEPEPTKWVLRLDRKPIVVLSWVGVVMSWWVMVTISLGSHFIAMLLSNGSHWFAWTIFVYETDWSVWFWSIGAMGSLVLLALRSRSTFVTLVMGLTLSMNLAMIIAWRLMAW